MKPLKLLMLGFLYPYLILYICAAYGYLTMDFTKYSFEFRVVQMVISLFIGFISWVAGNRMQDAEIEEKEKALKKNKEVSLEK